MLITILKANLEDADEILDLQRLAYESEARLYNDWSLPALTQTLASLRSEFVDSLVLKAIIDNTIVGSVRAKEIDDTCEIGRLIVHPQYQRQGIGSELLESIEGEFDQVKRYELFTGSASVSNIRLYERHGYTVTETKALSENIAITYLEKYA